ncbi:unnamed protein product [Closterium sp. NIES-53]
MVGLHHSDPAADDTAATRRSPRLETPPSFLPRLSLPSPEPVVVDSGAAGGGDTGGADSRGAGPEVADTRGAESGCAGSGGADSGGADTGGAMSPSGGGVVGASAGGSYIGQQQHSRRQETLSPQQLLDWVVWRGRAPRAWSTGAGGARAAGAGGTGGNCVGGARFGGAGGTGAAGAGGTVVAGVGGARAGGAGGARAGGAGGTEAAGAGGTEAAGAGGARVGGAGGTGPAGAGGTGAAGAGGARATGAGDARAGGAAGAGGSGVGGTGGTGAAGAGGPRAGGAGGIVAAGVGGIGAKGDGAGGTGGAGAGGAGAAVRMGTVPRRPFFYPQRQSSLLPPDSALCQVLSLPYSTDFTPPLLCPLPDQSQPPLLPGSPLPALSPYLAQTSSLADRREPESRPASHLRTDRRARHPRPPPVPGALTMALCPSSVPQRVALPSPLATSLPDVPDPMSDLARAASPTVTRLLATLVTDPSFESTTASALVTKLVDFAATRRLDYVESLVIES